MASSRLCRPSLARCPARRARADAELGADEWAASGARLAGPAAYLLHGPRMDRKVEVDASVRPERVEAEIRDHVDGRHPERRPLSQVQPGTGLGAAAHVPEHLGSHRVGRYDHVGTYLPHPAEDPPAGAETEQPGEGPRRNGNQNQTRKASS